jgi:hypothetical protein
MKRGREEGGGEKIRKRKGKGLNIFVLYLSPFCS